MHFLEVDPFLGMDTAVVRLVSVSTYCMGEYTAAYGHRVDVACKLVNVTVFDRYLIHFSNCSFSIGGVQTIARSDVLCHDNFWTESLGNLNRLCNNIHIGYKCGYGKRSGFEVLIGNYAVYALKNHPFLFRIIQNIHKSRKNMYYFHF